MSKSLVFVILFLIISFFANSQPRRVYLTGSGEITTNKQLATSYAEITQLPGDSAWMVNQFDLMGNVLSLGYYKDAQMSIPHGKFTYYHKVASGPGFTFMGKLVVDSVNCVMNAGYYINGVKTGAWLDYYNNGPKSTLRTYRNNLLDGLFQTYNVSGKVETEGYYVNNKREGDWCMLGEDSTANYTMIYKHDKLVKQIDYVHTAAYEKSNKNATPKFDFEKYISHIASTYTYTISSGQLTITFTVTKDGVATNPKVVQSYEPRFDFLISQAILNAPKWTPALSKGQPVDQLQYYTIHIVNSAMRLEFDNTYHLHKKYDPALGVFTYQ